MDTLIGYVSFIFDAETIKLKIIQQGHRNKHQYDNEELIRLSDVSSKGSVSPLRSIADHTLVDSLLYKKIEVKVVKKDPFEITGKVNVLSF